LIEEEKAKIPLGTRLMPEQERLETLQDLTESRKEISNTLERLPIGIRTIMMQNYKLELEHKLS
jgi:hypothetical protein